MSKRFWKTLTSNAGVYSIGEVADGNVDHVWLYGESLDGLIEFPLYYELINVFANDMSLNQFQDLFINRLKNI